MKTIDTNVIMSIVEKNLGLNQTLCDSNANLVDLGMDSLALIRIIVELEDTFCCEIPDDKLLITEMDTVEKITELIQGVCNGD